MQPQDGYPISNLNLKPVIPFPISTSSRSFWILGTGLGCPLHRIACCRLLRLIVLAGFPLLKGLRHRGWSVPLPLSAGARAISSMVSASVLSGSDFDRPRTAARARACGTASVVRARAAPPLPL